VKRVFAVRPSPATVISCIALFVALGGVSYGVATGSIDGREVKDGTLRTQDIRNNSIRASDLRNNEVRGIDVRNRTLRARDIALDTLTDDEIDESKLTQVPDAARLGGRLPGEFASAAQEAVHRVDATGEPTFQNGFEPLGGGAIAPGFWKDSLGVVHLEGSTDYPAFPVPVGELIFTLPPGYRPAATASFPGGRLSVGADGAVRASGGEPPVLDGADFRAAG
jgi:hypothetical protein